MSEREKVPLHQPSLAVWDLPSPIIVGRPATLKVGISCPSGCDLAGTRVDIYNETGTRVGGGRLGSVPWLGTTALYWAEVEVAAPGTEGDHSWSIDATPFAFAKPPAGLDGAPELSRPGSSHEHASSIVRFIAFRPPEHSVTLEVVKKGSGDPLSGVELRLGRFRATTNDAGIAYLNVLGGHYEVCAWKIGYNVFSTTAHVVGDTTIHLEVAVAAEPEQPYWM